jgi:TRAP-type C4-dicarboxylate transport system substrate-binding protein
VAALCMLYTPTHAAVLTAAVAAEERGWKLSEEKTKWYLEQLAKNGMHVSEGSAKLRADMKKIGETMTAEWAKKTGADGQAILRAYNK